MAGWQGLPPSHTDALNFLKYHKSNIGLKIGNFTNSIMLFSVLPIILYHHLFFMIAIVT